MARTVFVAGVVMKLILWAVMVVGLYVAVRALIEGNVGLGLLIVFIIIPVALWGVNLVLAIVNMLILYPIALVAGRRRELVEFNNFQLAAVELAGADRLTLRASKMLLEMFKELPPPAPGQRPRSGEELIALYNELHPEEEEEEEEEERVEAPKPEEPARARSIAQEVPPETKRPSRATAIPGKVLVIDDEAPLRMLYRVNLAEEGMEVVEAADGRAGLEQAKSESPDVILLDVMMPKLDGWRVAEELRKGPETRDIPFVFVTPRRLYRDQIRGLELGAVDYIALPFNPLELASRVREVLERRAKGELEELRRERIEEVRALIEQDPNGPAG